VRDQVDVEAQRIGDPFLRLVHGSPRLPIGVWRMGYIWNGRIEIVALVEPC
jgi:hypothetical protein